MTVFGNFENRLQQWRIYIVKLWTHALRSNFFHFHAVFGKFWPNNRLAPPFRFAAPNPWEILNISLGFEVFLKSYNLISSSMIKPISYKGRSFPAELTSVEIPLKKYRL